MQQEQVHAELVVVGGGLAGVSAAIAAARRGHSVALVQNRPVLGGNSSSEIRVWVCGATAHGVHRNARETGIMGELFVENQFRNIDGNPYYWDLTVLEAVRAEPNITLFLNTDVTRVDATGPADARRITAVTGWMQGSEREITFTADAFADCTGDGLVGFLAGAEILSGRESRATYGESWAPEVPDQVTLGSTILFYTKDVGHPVRFVPPPWTKDVVAAGIPDHRIIRESMNGCDYWWIEWGGELDVVADNERIRDELQSVVYGIWDYLKNSGQFDTENLTLEWIGSVPGKREYRRLVGDHVLTQHDVLGQTEFEDRAAFGGWSIDLHPGGGVYATQPGSLHWHPDGNYHIPLRSLYSRNVTNLWMAGRNISASHVAFGSTRVMATCAVLGEAAGLGAAVALEDGVTPREVATQRLDDYRRALLRADASVLGLENLDPDDAVLTAAMAASSTAEEIEVTESAGVEPLVHPLGVVVPISPKLAGLSIMVDVSAETVLRARLHRTSRPQNYIPAEEIATVEVVVQPGEEQWIELPLEWVPGAEDDDQGPADSANAFVVLEPNEHVGVHHGRPDVPGLFAYRYVEPPEHERFTEQWRGWKPPWWNESLRVKVHGGTDAYGPERARGGYSRPYGGPQLWASAPLGGDPEPWLMASWDEPQDVAEAMIIFDDDVDTDLINLHHHRNEHEAMPSLVRDYRLEARRDGAWVELATVRDNRRRVARHRIDPATGPIDALRVTVEATNGANRARVVALRAYRTPTS